MKRERSTKKYMVSIAVTFDNMIEADSEERAVAIAKQSLHEVFGIEDAECIVTNVEEAK